MIGRRTALAIANAYISAFRRQIGGFHSELFPAGYEVDLIALRDFLFENEHDEWLYENVRRQSGKEALKDWLLGLHAGRSCAAGLPNGSEADRRALGHECLKKLACDYLNACDRTARGPGAFGSGNSYWELISLLELDGYEHRDGKLFQAEYEVVDVEEEIGFLEMLYSDLGLPERKMAFGFLDLSREHFVAGRFSDCITNSRTFLDQVLTEVARLHFGRKGSSAKAPNYKNAASVREYLVQAGLLTDPEKEAVRWLFQLLSQGPHPYMTDRDQARLLRLMCLPFTQYIMLRLQGSLK